MEILNITGFKILLCHLNSNLVYNFFKTPFFKKQFYEIYFKSG